MVGIARSRAREMEKLNTVLLTLETTEILDRIRANMSSRLLMEKLSRRQAVERLCRLYEKEYQDTGLLPQRGLLPPDE